jgi:hypothetical protein
MTRPPALLTHHAAQQGDTPMSAVTLREYIATHVLAGLMVGRPSTDVYIVNDAVRAADALLAALAADREDA